MGAFFVYSLKSSICLAAFYLFYKLLLSRDTFHRFNRIVLLGTMILSVIIPVITITSFPVELLEVIPDISFEQYEILNPAPQMMVENVSPNRILSVILLTYLAGCGLFLIRNLWDLFHLLQIIRKGEHIQLDNNIRLTVHSDHRIAPFSWMKNIVVSQTDLNEAGDTILLHEQAHIRYYHSFDLLLAELCILFQWYNPAAWLLYSELQHIHEYEADQSVINHGINAKQYQLLLIKKAVGTRLYSMANSLNHSNLKKRITMMLQKKSNPYARLKYAYVLPLAAICLIAFACSEISSKIDEISNAKVSNLTINDKQDETENSFSDSPVFVIVEEMPEFPGGDNARTDYINQNLKYPVEAQENGIQGRVVCQFIVEKDGSISNVEVLRGIDPSLDREAFRLISTMPKWTPAKQRGEIVRVRFTLPIMFRLTVETQPVNQPTTSSAEMQVSSDSTIFVIVEMQPEFPGGDVARMDYISQNTRYPERAKNAGISGRVITHFVVEKDGSISNAEIIRGVDPELDAEALRLVRSMPKWTPGKQKGQIVRVKFVLPIFFRLQN